MHVYKKKIKVNNLAALLYIITIDANQPDKILERISESETLDRSKISRELILLRLIIVCYLLCSDKVFKSHRERVTRLHLEYMEHFEADEYKFEGEVAFVDLLESRMKTYKPLLENDCIRCALQIAQLFADNCGIKDPCGFVKTAKLYYLDSLLSFNKLLHSYKLK